MREASPASPTHFPAPNKFSITHPAPLSSPQARLHPLSLPPPQPRYCVGLLQNGPVGSLPPLIPPRSPPRLCPGLLSLNPHCVCQMQRNAIKCSFSISQWNTLFSFHARDFPWDLGLKTLNLAWTKPSAFTPNWPGKKCSRIPSSAKGFF